LEFFLIPVTTSTFVFGRRGRSEGGWWVVGELVSPKTSHHVLKIILAWQAGFGGLWVEQHMQGQAWKTMIVVAEPRWKAIWFAKFTKDW
jgi:hypothetical protein